MKKLMLFITVSVFLFAHGFAQTIHASYAAANYNESFSGNVIAYLSKENKNPTEARFGFETMLCYRVTVKNVKPGETVTIDDRAVYYPAKLSEVERGEYYIQIVWDRNSGGRAIGKSAGNLLNTTRKIVLSKNDQAVIKIVAENSIADRPAFIETAFVKELKAPSSLLGKFHNKKMTVDAAVILPKEYYTEPARKFPVLFVVSGYGGDYYRYSGDSTPGMPLDTSAFIRVFLDGNCALGHSVYANSANNGPWGDALVKEFIPLLETSYRCNGARLLTGHSSGGWTVLWLQTQYPELFHGCWSSSPDPVDFRNFQQINLYQDKNMFYGKDSSLRYVATVAGRIPWAPMKNIYQAENVVYRGEQMHSFDAVFSNMGSNGLPQMICNSATGEINTAVVEQWKKYDISWILRNNWQELKTGLDGKIRISVGTADNFLLNHAVTLLEEEMKKLQATIIFAYYPGDHFTVATADYKKDGNQFLAQKYQEWIAKSK